MKTPEQNLEFDFKKTEEANIDINNTKSEEFSEVFLEVCSKSFITVSIYIIISILILKMTHIDLLPTSYLLSKMVLTISAITQALKYINKKSLKIQLFNGVLHTGILLYLFKFDGFLSLASFLKQALGALIM